jgi:hypothetical protein
MTKRSKLLNNPVEHPAHYSEHPSGVEAIDICGDMNFCLGNAFKYMFRHEYKNNPIEDLKKARWYLRRYYFQVTGSTITNPIIWCEGTKSVPPNVQLIIDHSPKNIGKAIGFLWYAHVRNNVDDVETALFWLGREIRRKVRLLKKAQKLADSVNQEIYR